MLLSNLYVSSTSKYLLTCSFDKRSNGKESCKKKTFSSLLLLEDRSMEVSVAGSMRQRWAW